MLDANRKRTSTVLRSLSLSAALTTATLACTPAYAADVLLATGNEANWQSLITGAPANSTFIIESGVHYMGALSSPDWQTAGVLTPRSGDTFIGENGAVLKGSKVLPANPNFESTNIYYWDGQTQYKYNPYPGEQEPPNQRKCWYGNELFEINTASPIDEPSKRMVHVDTKAEMNADGEWFFDSDQDRIYIYSTTNPNLKTYETSTTETAFRLGTTANVTIENLTVLQYATVYRGENCDSAIDGGATTNLVCRNVEASWSHNGGINFGAGAIIENSKCAWNGEVGFGGGGGPVYIRNNEVTRNAQIPYRGGILGGLKVVHSIGGIFEQNYIHDNIEYGIWFDIANACNIIRSNWTGNTGNTVSTRIQRRGVFYEISGDVNKAPTLVYWNQIRESLDSGIDISSSANVSVFENQISTGQGSGISARQSLDKGIPRTPGLYKYRAWNNDVLLTNADPTRIQHSVNSVVVGESLASKLARVDLIDRNTYRGTERFGFFGTDVNFPTWQDNPTDAHLYDFNGSYSGTALAQPAFPSYVDTFEMSNYGPLTGDRVGYWRLDESSGSTASDVSGNDYHGTLSGNPIWTPSGGKRNGALDFEQDDGTANSDYVGLGTTPGSASALTVAFWMKPDQTNRRGVPIGKSSGSSLAPDSGKGWAIKLRETGAVWFRVGGENNHTDVQTPAGTYTTGWTHVAATFAGSTAKLYINGVLRATATGITQTVANTATALRFGKNSEGVVEAYDGLLDDVQIFDEALAATEIKAIAETAFTLKPVASWKLNMGTGDVAPDDSGNTHTGVVMGGPTWLAGQQGNAVNLNGSTQYVTVPHDSGLNLTANTTTFAAWVKLDNITGQRTVLSKNTSAFEFSIEAGKPRLDLKLSNGSTMSARTTNVEIAANTWYHVAVTRSGTAVSFYVNGAYKAGTYLTATSTLGLGINTGPVDLGRRPGGSNYLDGILDEVEMYSTALTAQDIVAIKDR